MFASRTILLAAACLIAAGVQAEAQQICCLAFPTCPADTTRDATCTAADVKAGLCQEATLCCSTIRCRVKQPETPICCQAMPSCPAGYEQTDESVCSDHMWKYGICRKASRCCKEITCRTWVM